MKYFTIKECTQSSTARARRIDNTPNSEHLAHIRKALRRWLTRFVRLGLNIAEWQNLVLRAYAYLRVTGDLS